MSVWFGVIVRTRINQRCVCVSSGVLVRSAPCDAGVCVLSPLCRSASCAGFSDGAVPRRLCGQKPIQRRSKSGCHRRSCRRISRRNWTQKRCRRRLRSRPAFWWPAAGACSWLTAARHPRHGSETCQTPSRLKGLVGMGERASTRLRPPSITAQSQAGTDRRGRAKRPTAAWSGLPGHPESG